MFFLSKQIPKKFISMNINTAIMNDTIRFGAVLCIGGVLFTAYSYFSAGDGDTFTIWWGVVVVGLGSMVKGFANEKQDKELSELKERTYLGQATKEDWNNSGTEFFALENYDEALKSFDMAIKMDPEYADAWVNKGTSLYRLGRYSEAIAAYDEAIRIQPQNANAWKRKGFALKKLGRNTDAADASSKAMELGYSG